MAESARPSINLLGHKGEGFLTQFLNWAVNIGRLLIILTETIALATFIYRFNLDMKIVDLHDKIKQESIIVSNFKSLEENFRNLQDRLSLAKKYDKLSQKYLTIFNDVTALGRGKVTFRNLMVSTNNVKIEVQAPSTTTLSEFVSALKAYPEFSSVTVDNVQSSPTNARITVAITAMLKDAEIKETTQTQPAQPAQVQVQGSQL